MLKDCWLLSETRVSASASHIERSGHGCWRQRAIAERDMRAAQQEVNEAEIREVSRACLNDLQFVEVNRSEIECTRDLVDRVADDQSVFLACSQCLALRD